MDASGWQNLWVKQYNNTFDERWKTKSLNPLPPGQYQIPLPKPIKIVSEPITKEGKNPKKQKIQNNPPNQDQLLPSPKMNKINDTMFCISMQRDVHLFYLITNQEEKTKMRQKKAFGMITHNLSSINQKIELVTGNNSNYIFLATKNNLVVLEIMDSKNNGTKDGLKLKFTRVIPDLITILALEKRLIALTATHLYELDTENQFKEVSAKRIEFSSSREEDLYKTLMPVGIVTGVDRSIFYFGSRIEEQIDLSKLKGAPGEQTQRKMKSQALTIVKLSISGQTKVEQVKGKVFQIDHIFELGIFTRSKIYEIEKETFLVSLHEQVVLIKKNFDRYIVWDNVSVVSSKSQSKKGQLILAAQKILVFSENVQIFAHEIFFNQEQSKLAMPPIDNFKGNDNDQLMLYDAILLYYEDSIIKVLAYIKPTTVVYPTNDSNFKKRETDPNKIRDEATSLDFTIICISQSDPKRKLEQLLSQKSTTNKEIQTFCHRFNISKQDETKSRWNVSLKELKDIENVLMQIQQDKFIQTELDNILKAKSHNLDFLSSVQAKQISRLKRLFVDRICAYSEMIDEHRLGQAEHLLLYIYQILQWYMESEMFLKKVTYSKKFLSFKQYDFIQIGKLKAASLKEQIKLLSSKKFEKRLKYFLNSFKILVISNYQQVFGFLLEKKNISEISEFIKEFKFILPIFQEPSPVFIQQKDYSIYDKKRVPMLQAPTHNDKRSRSPSFAAGVNDYEFRQFEERRKDKQKEKEKLREKEKQKMKETQRFEKEQRCELWDPLQDKQGCKISETLEYFEQKIIEQLKLTNKSEMTKKNSINNFKKILHNFKGMKWFETAAFKQHSMITKSTKEVHEEFKQLKRKGAFKILVKFLYKKITEPQSKVEDDINQMLDLFIKNGIIPESFKKNVDARVLVYRNLLQANIGGIDKRLMGLQLPLLQDFIVKSQEKYFYYLFTNIRNLILTKVKEIYQSIEPNFFRERFQMFLQSNLIIPNEIIDFVDSFNEEVEADSIRVDVFNAIKRLLKLSDKTNSENYIRKCMDCEVLPQNDDNQTGKLREEAKIPYGFFFYHFFKVFNLDYSYLEFISFTNTPLIKQCKVIQELVSRYCKSKYELQQDFSGTKVCSIRFEEIEGIHQKIPDIDIHNQPLEFFGIILHLLDVLDFQIEEKDVFQLILENYLSENKFKQLSDFIMKLKEYHLTQYNLQTSNYKMISDFKEEIDIDRQFISYVINWIQRNYKAIQNVSDIDDKMKANENALKMLTNFNKNAIEIKSQKSLFQLLSNIKKFDNGLILNVEYIKEEAKSNSSFIFLMHRLNQIVIEKFRESIDNEAWFEALNNFSEMFMSHKQYAYEEIADPSHPDFLRFLIQLCMIMIEENIFPIARYLITKRIPNDQYYFKDVLLYFLTAIKIQNNRSGQFREKVVKHILLPETTSMIKENLENQILNYFRVSQFIPIKEQRRQIAHSDKKQSRTETKQEKWQILDKSQPFIQRSVEMFQMIMSRYRKDDAFFYLVRIKKVYNDKIIGIASNYKSKSVDESDQKRQNIEFRSYLLITSYIKAIQLFIEQEFYPTYAFFQSKMILLQDNRERKDIIKDVNIALSKLDRIKVQSAQKKKHLELAKQELEAAYNAYMKVIGQNPDIRLTDNEGRGLDATKKVEVYSRKANDMFMQQTMKEAQYKKQLQKNLEKVNQIQEDTRINVMQREVTEKISQIKKVNQRHALLEADLRKEDHEESLAVRRQRQLQNIRKTQKEDIQSLKDTYKSNTTKRVNDLIENLRKNREKVAAKRNAPTSAIRDQGKESNNFSKSPNIQILQPPPSIRNKFQSLVAQSPKSDLLSDNLLPITMKGKVDRIQTIRQQMKSSGTTNNKILDLQKKMFTEQAPEAYMNSKKKANFDDIAHLYKEKESEEAYKCIQKYDMLKNPQVRAELIKRAYAVTMNLENFLEYLRFLLSVDESWKESIEEKSINIATQMIKMQNKEKINTKEIIPVEFFTTVVKLSLKDYYSHAFEIFKPSIKKIFEKDLMAVHAVGILFRYTLGSQNRFYGKIFYEYFKVLLKNYEIKNMDDKELTLLAQKIRSNYTSLPDNKDQVLQELIMGISNPLKKSRLLDALKRTLERKGESLVGGQANKEITYVLQKLMK